MVPKTISEILNEVGENREEYFNAVAPPIMQTSNFAFKKVAELRKVLKYESSGYLYSRGLNPTVKILSEKLAALDGAEDCLVFSSGAAAIFSSVLANVKSGDHIISVEKPYTWAEKIFNNILPKFNVSVTYVDGTKIENFENAIKENTTLIYLETPNSWSFELQDLEAVAKLAKSKNILTICDNSYCSPLYQQPISFGIDLVLQSATKYINGHSDVVAGVLCGRKALIKKIFHSEYLNIGAGISPFNAWLMLRGLRTFQVRLSHISKTTKEVVSFLKSRPEVEEVIYPFDESFTQFEMAKKQMKGAGGLFSFYLVADSLKEVEHFCESLQRILIAVSWGGYESLIIPGCASIDEKDFDPDERNHRRLRMYVGLEDAKYLIEDLKRGFAGMKK
ncbi:MAG: trans-sulfuration enzyme family protein [Ginsengibacter sp.]